MNDKFKLRYLDQSEFLLWDQFVDRSSNGMIFNKTIWLVPNCKFKNLQLKILGCFDNNDDLVGGFAFGNRRLFGIYNIIDIPLSTPYMHIVLADRESKYQSKSESYYFEVYGEIIGFLKRHFVYINVILPPLMRDCRPLTWAGFRSKISYTYMTELNDIDELYNDFNHSIRKQLKKSEKLEYHFELNNSDERVRLLYELEAMVYKRQGFSNPYEQDQFNELVFSLREQNLIRLYTIFLKDTPVASRVEIVYKNQAYDWKTGARPEHFETGLNQLMFYEILKDLNENNIRKFDFGGANTNSIAKYKSTFNFQLMPYYDCLNVYGAIPKLLWMAKNMKRNIL